MDPLSIAGALVFGCLGLFAWQYGRRRSDARKLLAGAGLIGIGFFLDGWALWLAGLGLGLVAFIPAPK